jgi:hypothetical protein
MARVRFCFIVPLLYPMGVMLSVCKDSSRIVRSTVPYFAFNNTAPLSASVADDITCLRTVVMMRMTPLVSFLALSVLLPV